jgi:hypothetical protein
VISQAQLLRPLNDCIDKLCAGGMLRALLPRLVSPGLSCGSVDYQKERKEAKDAAKVWLRMQAAAFTES